jgi:hypothetical protein
MMARRPPSTVKCRLASWASRVTECPVASIVTSCPAGMTMAGLTAIPGQFTENVTVPPAATASRNSVGSQDDNVVVADAGSPSTTSRPATNPAAANE